MLVVIDYEATIHLWKVDTFDFVVCLSAYIGVVFGSVETGLVLAVRIIIVCDGNIISNNLKLHIRTNISFYFCVGCDFVIRVLLFVARPRTFVQGNLPNSTVYRNVEQYPNASNVPGILILEIDAPIYFANTNYLRKRY